VSFEATDEAYCAKKGTGNIAMIYIIITFMKWRAENFRILAELS
jgi:hypothetical protein